jgi:hypothetical protein
LKPRKSVPAAEVGTGGCATHRPAKPLPFLPGFDEDAHVTRLPILRRELLLAARRERPQAHRLSFAMILLAIVLATFLTWYYWSDGAVSHVMMAEVAERSFLWIVAFHGLSIMNAVARSALAIAGEKDRRTFDFLLVTRLSSAEIVLQKLGACFAVFVTTTAAGLPLVLLIHRLGGIDWRLIALIYAALATTTFLVTSLAIFVSAQVPQARRSVNVTVLVIGAWLAAPFWILMVLPRLGIALPRWAVAANVWLLDSSPLGPVMKVVQGSGASNALLYAIAWMAALQLAGGVLLLIGAIARLRSAARTEPAGENRGTERPRWRLRARPPVSDDPILWREMHTTNNGLLHFVFAWITRAVVLVFLAYPTYVFTRPALAELWEHGYRPGVTTTERPEFNLFIRFFVPSTRAEPVDAARTALNLYLRFVTAGLATVLVLAAAGAACEVIGRERAKETWASLLATPLAAREIIRSLVRATVWRTRESVAILLVLWSIGLIAGAIHPLGFLVSLAVVAAATWMAITAGILASIRALDAPAVSQRGLGVITILLASGIVPFLLPRELNSVLAGSGSVPFVLWLSLVSYRDVGLALEYAAYPPIQWMGIGTGEGALRVLAGCAIGIVSAALMALRAWRRGVADFDRLAGRPWRIARRAQDESPATAGGPPAHR